MKHLSNIDLQLGFRSNERYSGLAQETQESNPQTSTGKTNAHILATEDMELEDTGEAQEYGLPDPNKDKPKEKFNMPSDAGEGAEKKGHYEDVQKKIIIGLGAAAILIGGYLYMKNK